MMSKILKAYKKGEWLLFIAILFQVVGSMIICVKHIESGMGVFSFRIINLIGTFFLCLYLIIEIVFLIVKMVEEIKKSGGKTYFKQNWVNIVLYSLLLLCSLVLSIIGIYSYFTARRNYNLDYNYTNFVFGIALFLSFVYALLKCRKQGYKEWVVFGLMSALVLIFVVLAGVRASDYQSSIELNLYLLIANFLMLTFTITYNHNRTSLIFASIMLFLGTVTLITGGILGGTYNFSTIDFFYWTRFACVVSFIVVISFASMVLVRTIRSQEQEKLLKIMRIVLLGISIILSLVFLCCAINIRVAVPNDMKRLDICYIFSMICTLLSMIAVMLRGRQKITMSVSSGVTLIALIILTVFMALKSKLTGYSSFYKFSIISTSIMLFVIIVGFVLFLINLKIEKNQNEVKPNYDNVNNETKIEEQNN